MVKFRDIEPQLGKQNYAIFVSHHAPIDPTTH